ncbi:MAG: thioredoxin domain-containing protein, partial [Bacteroidota bacterium]
MQFASTAHPTNIPTRCYPRNLSVINQLSKASSPYLRQHANNPVHWQQWNEATLARAREADKPVLVSIGYSTCHWCHVMERESFEDEGVARLMNEHFVCIKVDREERPDVDRIYMEACQAINGSGGWPLNAFLLPDGRPFYAGTYYPPERKYNRPSWTELLEHLAELYRNDQATVQDQANRLIDNIRGGGTRLLRLEPEAEDHAAWRETVLGKLRATYDLKNGGFGGAPKFPSSQPLEALLAHGVLHREFNDQHLAAHSTLAMLDGGIYDQLGGGFSRYTVDAAWRVPHFEKMLYDNALVLRLLGKLQLAQPQQRFLDAIAETTDWLQREMLLPTGGYRAALDADSEGVEGKYYVWTLKEVNALLPPDQTRLVTEFYGFTEEGNWEEERVNIPYRPETLAAVAAKIDLPLDVAREQLAAARKTLHDYRFQNRVHPGADDKLILQWNALLISGWTWCYRATQDDRYLNLAEELWRVLHEQLYVAGQWHRNLTHGDLGAPAFLDDYAALAEAALDLHEVTFKLEYALGAAGQYGPEAGAGSVGLIEYILDHFAADAGPMFQLRPNAGNELPLATVDLFDNALPSGNSQTMHLLLRLARLTGREDLLRRGEEMLAAMAGSLERYPSSFGGWLHAALLHAAPDRELAVTGPGARSAAVLFL